MSHDLMDADCALEETYEFGDQATSDVVVRLVDSDSDGRQDSLSCHSFVLKKNSKFFASRFSSEQTESNKCIEVSCASADYDHFVKLMKLLYLPEDSLLDSMDSVKSTLGILRASITLQCDALMQVCIQYLEAAPWELKEEEEIIAIVPTLGSAGAPILARVQPAGLNATKNVFISAMRMATTTDKSFPPFGDELKTSAQEQVDYMLLEDEEAAFVVVDDDVRAAARAGLLKLFETFEVELSFLSSDSDRTMETTEQAVLQPLSDIEWICGILPKLEMMVDFVSCWLKISHRVIELIQGNRYSSGLWAVKMKLIELAAKALDAVGYGDVLLPPPSRLSLLNMWLPWLRKMKPLLDSKCEDEAEFLFRMDSNLCENIEGAIVSLVLALPSNDQAEILTDWMNHVEKLSFPDLSEAFEVWCYRTKTAKRKLFGVDDTSV